MTTTAHALNPVQQERSLLLQEPLWHKELAVLFTLREMEHFYAQMQPLFMPGFSEHTVALLAETTGTTAAPEAPPLPHL
jgi:hypothetical protein